MEEQNALRMQDVGALAGLNFDQILKQYPDELTKWTKHRYQYRPPGGESQADLACTLKPFIRELERKECPVLIISHTTNLRVLYGYFVGSNLRVNDYMNTFIPSDTIIELSSSVYGWTETRYEYCPDKTMGQPGTGGGRCSHSKHNSASFSPILTDLKREVMVKGGRLSDYDQSHMAWLEPLPFTLVEVSKL